MASEFGLDSRPSNTGLLAHLAGLGHAFKGVLVVGGTALGVIGLYSDAAEAFEAADQLLAEGDPIGADAEVYGFAAKQLLSTSRLIASYAASDGSLADTLARNEQLTNEWAEAAKRAYIARTLADMAARGEAIPQKYDGFLTSGDAEVLADGTAVGHLDTGQSFEFSWSATGLSMTASDAQGNTVYAASLDAAGNATLLHSAPDASSVELFMQAGAEWPSFAESSPLGELIAVGDFVEGANGGPTIVSQQRATDGSGEPIGSWQTTVTKAPVDEQPVLVHPEPQIISGYQIGQAFGSALGQLIGGSNTFARIAAGSALGVVLGNVGETLQIYFNDTWVSGSAPPQNVTLAQAAELSFANFGAELASGFASAGLGAASAYLTAEPRHQCQRHRRAARTRMSTGVESLAFGRAPLR